MTYANCKNKLEMPTSTSQALNHNEESENALLKAIKSHNCQCLPLHLTIIHIFSFASIPLIKLVSFHMSDGYLSG